MSVCRLLILQRKPELGLTKPWTAPNASRRLDIAGLDFLDSRKMHFIRQQQNIDNKLLISCFSVSIFHL